MTCFPIIRVLFLAAIFLPVDPWWETSYVFAYLLDMQLFRRIPNIRKSKSATVDISYFLGGCTYGGELAWLGGLARLCEISPSLGTLIKICVHMSSELARLGWISFDFAGIPPRWDENFPYEHAQVGQPGKVG